MAFHCAIAVGQFDARFRPFFGTLNDSTTLAFYVKTSGADDVAEMERLEEEMGNDWATPKPMIVQ